jgi:hypothetical protein
VRTEQCESAVPAPLPDKLADIFPGASGCNIKGQVAK